MSIAASGDKRKQTAFCWIFPKTDVPCRCYDGS